MATLCRKVVDSACDLGEYCDGVSQYCPSDAYIADGTHCQTDEVCICIGSGVETRVVKMSKIFGLINQA